MMCVGLLTVIGALTLGTRFVISSFGLDETFDRWDRAQHSSFPYTGSQPDWSDYCRS